MIRTGRVSGCVLIRGAAWIFPPQRDPLVPVDKESAEILYPRPMRTAPGAPTMLVARSRPSAGSRRVPPNARPSERKERAPDMDIPLSVDVLSLINSEELKEFTKPRLNDLSARIDTLWVFAAGTLVMLMQAGFLLLEVGFSRMKNAGTIAAKVFANLSIAAIAYWAVGFALAFGGNNGDTGWFAGDAGFFLQHPSEIDLPALSFSDATVGSKFFFQFAFAAVSLAIVWGTTLERIKFGAYLIYAVIFSAVIYPVISHWIFGGGWLQVNFGMQDFAGSTVIHLLGATGALAALLLLGPRQGKYGRDGNPNVIPGHSMPLVGLGVLIRFVGWFGFNPGSTLGVADGRFAEVAIVTVIGAAGGVMGAMSTSWLLTRTFDIGMTGNGVIAGLVGITAGSGYVEYWAAIPIGLVAGILVVVCVIAIDKVLDDPIGALSAHGVAGILGTIARGLFTPPRLAEDNAI